MLALSGRDTDATWARACNEENLAEKGHAGTPDAMASRRMSAP
jgi:hypothetical protein